MSRIQASSSGVVDDVDVVAERVAGERLVGRVATTVTGSKCDTARATAAQVPRASSASSSVSPSV